MNQLLTLAAVAALATGCAATAPKPVAAIPARVAAPPSTALVGGPPSPGAAIAAELGFHGPRGDTEESD